MALLVTRYDSVKRPYNTKTGKNVILVRGAYNQDQKSERPVRLFKFNYTWSNQITNVRATIMLNHVKVFELAKGSLEMTNTKFLPVYFLNIDSILKNVNMLNEKYDTNLFTVLHNKSNEIISNLDEKRNTVGLILKSEIGRSYIESIEDVVSLFKFSDIFYLAYNGIIDIVKTENQEIKGWGVTNHFSNLNEYGTKPLYIIMTPSSTTDMTHPNLGEGQKKQIIESAKNHNSYVTLINNLNVINLTYIETLLGMPKRKVTCYSEGMQLLQDIETKIYSKFNFRYINDKNISLLLSGNLTNNLTLNDVIKYFSENFDNVNEEYILKLKKDFYNYPNCYENSSLYEYPILEKLCDSWYHLLYHYGASINTDNTQDSVEGSNFMLVLNYLKTLVSYSQYNQAYNRTYSVTTQGRNKISTSDVAFFEHIKGSTRMSTKQGYISLEDRMGKLIGDVRTLRTDDQPSKMLEALRDFDFEFDVKSDNVEFDELFRIALNYLLVSNYSSGNYDKTKFVISTSEYENMKNTFPILNDVELTEFLFLCKLIVTESIKLNTKEEMVGYMVFALISKFIRLGSTMPTDILLDDRYYKSTKIFSFPTDLRVSATLRYSSYVEIYGAVLQDPQRYNNLYFKYKNIFKNLNSQTLKIYDGWINEMYVIDSRGNKLDNILSFLD